MTRLTLKRESPLIYPWKKCDIYVLASLLPLGSANMTLKQQ